MIRLRRSLYGNRNTRRANGTHQGRCVARGGRQRRPRHLSLVDRDASRDVAADELDAVRPCQAHSSIPCPPTRLGAVSSAHPAQKTSGKFRMATTCLGDNPLGGSLVNQATRRLYRYELMIGESLVLHFASREQVNWPQIVRSVLEPSIEEPDELVEKLEAAVPGLTCLLRPSGASSYQVDLG